MIWREKRTLLIVLGILLAANTVFFFTYRVQYQSRLDALDERMAMAESQLVRARRERADTERTLQSYRGVERDVKAVFEQHWSTREQRLTALIAEVKRLALASGMQPQAYAFRQTQASAAADRKRRVERIGATEVGISFAVDGSYEQVRRLINLLELSNQFVIIDQITLVSREGDHLTLNLQLKTLFRGESARQRS